MAILVVVLLVALVGADLLERERQKQHAAKRAAEWIRGQRERDRFVDDMFERTQITGGVIRFRRKGTRA